MNEKYKDRCVCLHGRYGNCLDDTRSRQHNMKNMRGMHHASMMMSSNTKTTTIEGQGIGLNCYLSTGAHGASAYEWQSACVKKGGPEGILTKGGQVYLATIGRGKPAILFLLPYMEQEVKVTGMVHDRSGISLVNVASVKPIKGMKN